MTQISPVRAMATGTEIRRVDRFIAHDAQQRTGGRRRRENASPDFIAMIVIEMGEELLQEEFNAFVVESGLPDRCNTSTLPPGTPAAVAEVRIEDDTYYLMFVTPESRYSDGRLDLLPGVVQYDGEPRELLNQKFKFELEG